MEINCLFPLVYNAFESPVMITNDMDIIIMHLSSCLFGSHF